MMALVLGQFVIVDSLHVETGFINGVAWNSDLGLISFTENWRAKIYKVDPATMDTIYVRDYYWNGFMGMTYVPDRGRLFVIYENDSIWDMDTSNFQLLNRWAAPTTRYPYGLAYDGTYLWYTDQGYSGNNWEGTVFKLELPVVGEDTVRVVKSFTLGHRIKDAAWLNGYLWVVDENCELMKVDTGSGGVVEQWQLPISHPCGGLAWGGGYLWVGTNGGTGMLYKLYVTLGNEEGAPSLPARPRLVGNALQLPEGKWDVEVYGVDGRLRWSVKGVSGLVGLPKLGLSVIRVSGEKFRVTLKAVLK